MSICKSKYLFCVVWAVDILISKFAIGIHDNVAQWIEAAHRNPKVPSSNLVVGFFLNQGESRLWLINNQIINSISASAILNVEASHIERIDMTENKYERGGHVRQRCFNRWFLDNP